MATYTALVSLMNSIDLIENHSRHSFSFDKKQISSLSETSGFLLEFIESYNFHDRSKEVGDLEIRIASAARSAEDALEALAVEQILAGSTLDHGDDPIPAGTALDHGEDHDHKSSSFSHKLLRKMKAMKRKVVKEAPQKQRSTIDDADYREWKGILAPFPTVEKRPSYSFDLERIVDRMDSVIEQVMKVKEEVKLEHQQQPTDSMAAPSLRRYQTKGKTSMVGFDGYLIRLMDVLTGQLSTRKIISVVGMGGIGKTTLARNMYQDLLILQYFDIRAWATVSQEHDMKEVLLELLCRKGESTRDTIGELGEQLHKKLSGRRYLIVLDDMWSSQVWDRIRFFFPDNGNGSSIVLTTRISKVSSDLSTSSLVMGFLDEDKSWELFCVATFGEDECPLDLVEIGKKIVGQCRGLPLSIVVIGGHLRKSSRTKKEWAEVGCNMISVLDSGEDQCLSILSLSYDHLPVCLKPCFLYMGIFPEDKEILVSTLIRFWVAEGFLKPDGARSSEEIAEGYLKDLVDRNLILVQKQGRNGKILTCNVHDLLRELCLKVGDKERFFCVLKHAAAGSRCKERGSVDGCLICDAERFWLDTSRFLKILPEVEKVLTEMKFDPHYLESLFQTFNLRYIRSNLLCVHSRQSFEYDGLAAVSEVRACLPYAHLPSSISHYWNLQTLVLGGIFVRILAPSEIWEMPQLRHVDIFELIRLPHPPSNDFVMQNLRTLLVVENFKPSEEVCRRIPNIKELQIYYNLEASSSSSSSSSSEYCQNNLGRFHKLESLRCEFAEELNWRIFALDLTYPSTLQELWLGSSGLHWEDLSRIGSLPHLEVLTLSYANSVKGEEWSPIEGEFLSLKSLMIYNCDDLVCWNAERSHFPVLETLTLGYAYKLVEFPSDIGEIPTLQRVYLDRCSVSMAISAMRMLVEQEELENEDLRLEVQFGDKEELERVEETVQEEGLECNNLFLKYYSVE